MPNGYAIPSFAAQPLQYGPTISGAGAPIAGLMGGIQRGLQMRQQMQQLRATEAQQQAAQQQATQQEQIQALRMQAATDPAALQQLAGVDPQAARALQEFQATLDEEELAETGRVGALMLTSNENNARAVYERTVKRVRDEGDNETDLDLPSRAEAADMSDKELNRILQMRGRQLSDISMGAEKAEEARMKRREFEFRSQEIEAKKGKQDITALQKNLIAAGLKPGTEEYRKAVLDSINRGTVVNVGPQTESQRKDEFMADQVNMALEEINDVLDTPEFDPTSVKTLIMDRFGNVANFAKSTEWQSYEGAVDAIIEMYLNKITGAAYSDLQKQGAEKRFKIRPGDDPDTVELKLKRIQDLADSLNKSAGISPEETPRIVEQPPSPGAVEQLAAPAGPGQVVDWGSL